MGFQVQMRQSNKFGSVRNDEINNLHLGSGWGPVSQHPLYAGRYQPQLLIPSSQDNQPGEDKEFRNGIKLPTNQIVLP